MAGSQQIRMGNWKRYGWWAFCVFQVIVILIAAEKPANAYVDPGSGLLFLQVAGSMLMGALYVLRAKIRKLFRLGNSAVETTDETASGNGAEAEPHA